MRVLLGFCIPFSRQSLPKQALGLRHVPGSGRNHRPESDDIGCESQETAIRPSLLTYQHPSVVMEGSL